MRSRYRRVLPAVILLAVTVGAGTRIMAKRQGRQSDPTQHLGPPLTTHGGAAGKVALAGTTPP